MTWKEFKDAVEAQGVKDEDGIEFIDWSGWAEQLRVERSKNGRVSVT